MRVNASVSRMPVTSHRVTTEKRAPTTSRRAYPYVCSGDALRDDTVRQEPAVARAQPDLRVANVRVRSETKNAARSLSRCAASLIMARLFAK